jgi:hypothetical protein
MTESTPAENTTRANPQVVLETGLGRIVIEVYEDRAPMISPLWRAAGR